MASRVLVPLAEGFEEIEAVTIVDVLRRADVEVVVAGLTAGVVRGAHGIEVTADTVLANVDGASFDVLVLPGGQPGSKHLAADERVLSLVRAICARGGTVAAICAAPTVLAQAGILGGVAVTSHPSVRGKLGDAQVLDEPRVVRSGKIVTSQGAGTAMEFALDLVAQLAGPARADELARAMVVAR
jgi:4-methyl-5(b-hydroxyethyl)-thiazole monophosphate biosynthesis